MQGVLDRVKPEHLKRNYGIDDWTDAEDFMTRIAMKQGRLLKVSFAEEKGFLLYLVWPHFDAALLLLVQISKSFVELLIHIRIGRRGLRFL